jgi:hypothetical protein
MEKLSLRMLALSAAFCAAATLGTAALLWTGSPAAAETSRSATVHLSPAQPTQDERAPSDPAPLYVLRSVNDELCISRGQTLLRRTGVSTLSLPREDREMLSNGIAAASQEALASLLEDLCS